MTLWLTYQYHGLVSEEQESGYLSLEHSENLGTSAFWIPAAIDTLLLASQCRWCLLNRRVLGAPHPHASIFLAWPESNSPSF